MPEVSDPAAVSLTDPSAQPAREGPVLAIVRTSEEFSRWLHDPRPGVDELQVEGLLNDPDVWALAAQGTAPIPLDVILGDPATEYSALYRLVDVRLVRPVRVTMPAQAGFMKALRLAASLQIPVRLLPGQPGAASLEELVRAMNFYLRDPMVEAPVEFFHSLLAAFRGTGAGTIWLFLEQDPAIFTPQDAWGQVIPPRDFVATHLNRLLREGAECATCRWQPHCAGYFKWPDPAYDCAGVKQLFATLESVAEEITRDLAGHELPAS